MTATAFTDLVGCRRPVQLASMPGVCTPELAAAVSEAGGLGMVGGVMLPPDALRAVLDEVRGKTQQPFGVNFLMPFIDDREPVSVAAEHARVVEFFYGDPDASLVDLVHEQGALCSWQAGSVAEVEAAEQAGCDFVIAQGIEAGGHVRGTIGTLPLVTQVVERAQVPVLAAGGVTNAHDVVAMLAAGAAGVRVGSRFLVAEESGAHPQYVEAVLAARGEDTVLTEAFSSMWPHAPHRVLRSCVEAGEACEDDIIGETVHGGQPLPIPRWGVPNPTTQTTGHIEAMALYAGQGIGGVTRREPAADIVADLVRLLPR